MLLLYYIQYYILHYRTVAPWALEKFNLNSLIFNLEPNSKEKTITELMLSKLFRNTQADTNTSVKLPPMKSQMAVILLQVQEPHQQPGVDFSDLVFAWDKRYIIYLVRWQGGEGLDDGSQGHLRLLGHIGGAWHVVGGAADKPRAGIP